MSQLYEAFNSKYGLHQKQHSFMLLESSFKKICKQNALNFAQSIWEMLEKFLII
jgi:hypothetical protein